MKKKTWKRNKLVQEPQIIRSIEHELLTIRLGVDWKIQKSFPIDKESQGSGVNDYDALQYAKVNNNDGLFRGLNPSHYDFDYRRAVLVWEEFNSI